MQRTHFVVEWVLKHVKQRPYTRVIACFSRLSGGAPG